MGAPAGRTEILIIVMIVSLNDSNDEAKTDSDDEATDSDDEARTDSDDDEIDDSDNDLQVARRYSPSPPKLQRRVVSYERTTTEKWNYAEEYSD